ncbi:hypothetical protein myaer102_16210 [Microcystis viridis NIES-102]|uniref:Hyalin repeat protein n=1 Tax=Microcystis viridis NIES-102 TaxID=213615 RepID=A0A3G9JEV9_MICVR|nr:hypothetical protein myaer102_16210 [Microcystis viridis NIES-102]
MGNTLFFSANDGVNGFELWKSDGTATGTVLLKNILPGFSWSGPSNLTAVGSTLFFRANDGVNGQELWKSDGTAAGTVLLKPTFRTLSVTTSQKRKGRESKYLSRGVSWRQAAGN